MAIAQEYTYGRHPLLLFALTAWTLGGVVFYMLAPMAGPILLALAFIAPLTAFRLVERRFLPLTLSPAIVTLYMAALYLLINASWSLDKGAAYVSATALLFFVFIVHLTVEALRADDGASLRAMSIGFIVAFAVVGALICFELLTDQAWRRLLMSHAAWLRPPQQHLRSDGDWITFLQPYLLNRNIMALTLLFWPAVLVLRTLDLDRRLRFLLALGLALAVVAIFGSYHETSQIALLGSAAVLGLTWLSRWLGKQAMAVGWIAAVVLVVPLASLAYSQELYRASWLPASAQHRIVIWGHTSDQVRKAPILGTGILSERTLRRDNYDAPRVPESEFSITNVLHTHNGYLQTWYEAGAAGALLLLVLGLAILRAFAGTPPEAQPFLYATFASCALMGASSFSLWQLWFMAAFGMVAVFATLAAELTRRYPRGSLL